MNPTLELLSDDIIRNEFENLKEKTNNRPIDLYLCYKQLSIGVFEEYVGKYEKNQLCLMRDRNLTCAKLRMKYTRLFIDPRYRDQGHLQIVCAAIIKAIACHIASQPTSILCNWYSDMIIIHQAVQQYNSTSLEECKTAVTKEMIWYKPGLRDAIRRLPNFLFDRVIHYSLENSNVVLDLKFSPKIFWTMAGFNTDPLVKLLWPSL